MQTIVQLTVVLIPSGQVAQQMLDPELMTVYQAPLTALPLVCIALIVCLQVLYFCIPCNHGTFQFVPFHLHERLIGNSSNASEFQVKEWQW
jgi:hypothetical protein